MTTNSPSADDIKSSPAPITASGKGPAGKRGRKRWAIWAAVICMLLGAGYLLSQRSAPAPQAKAKKGGAGRGAGGATPVSISPVKQGNIGIYVNALGTVTPVYTVTVTSRVAGELMEVHYREGQMVTKGDLLAVIDPRPYQAALVQAEGQLDRDQAILHNARIDLTRYQTALEQHAIPEQQYATQQASVNQSEGAVKVDQGILDAARVNVGYTRITAPITGRVGLRQMDPGNIVQANGTAPLLSITQLQPITVVFTMAEDYISEVVNQMRAGHNMRVDALDRDNQTLLAHGTVLTLDNQIDPTTGTVKVKATFANQDNRLFPNEFVNARLLVRTLNNVNLVPTAAIQRNNDIAYVYVVNADQTAHSRNVKIATTDGDTAAVTGVNPGESLVIDGFDRLQEGSKVTIRKPATPSGRGPGGTPSADNGGETPAASDQSQPGPGRAK